MSEQTAARIHPARKVIETGTPGIKLELDTSLCIAAVVYDPAGPISVRTISDVRAFVDALWQALGEQHAAEYPAGIEVQEGVASSKWLWTCTAHGYTSMASYDSQDQAHTDGNVRCARVLADRRKAVTS
jgi:hypothetical protein